MTLEAPYREFFIGRSGLKAWIHGAPDRIAAPHMMPAYWFASIGVRRTFARDGSISAVDPMLMGPTLTPYEYRPEPRTELIGLAIQPEWTPVLVGLRTSEIDREHVWDRPGSILRGALRVAETGVPARQLAEALGASAVAQIAKAAAPDRRLSTGLGFVRRSAGRVAIGAVADRLDVHQRHFRRQLVDAIGLAPKHYARLVRFNAALARADQSAAPNWAGIAADFGYSDQAHLVREARTLAGATPAKLHADRHAESVFFNPCG